MDKHPMFGEKGKGKNDDYNDRAEKINIKNDSLINYKK